MATFFQRLFGNNKHASTEENPFQDHADNNDQLPKPQSNHYEPFQFIVGCAQSVGLQREHNEDALFTLTTNMVSDDSQLPFGLYIVADGMGGHQYGELASGLAVRAVSNMVIRKLFTPIYSAHPSSPKESILEILNAAIQDAHQVVSREAPGGGTTMTAVLMISEQMTVAHVGDSRAYLLTPEGEFHPLTRDHSLVKRLVELGQITIDEAAYHPQRNVLYRALGQGEPVEADINTSPLPYNSHLLICSDGLWGVVPEEELMRLIQDSSSPQQACQRMVDAANAAGGPDNITAVLVHMPGED
jgi:serine/threonine protein phosphatase PrpC